MNHVGGSSAGGADGHKQIQNTADLGAGIDPQFVTLRNNLRERIFENIRKQSSVEWGCGLPELARRVEEILFRKFQNMNEYYNMTKGPIEPQLQLAIKIITSGKQQMPRQITSSSGYTMIPTPGIAQVTNINSGLYVTDSMDLLLSGTHTVPQNANMGTSLPATDEHMNRLTSMGINTRHDCSRVSNNDNDFVINIMGTPETNIILPQVANAPSDTMKEVLTEPKFSCPVCMNYLVDASSTICGHIFCETCIKASIKAQKKCPTCRRKLTLRNFHRVYLPTVE